jgi:hypothetical protein
MQHQLIRLGEIFTTSENGEAARSHIKISVCCETRENAESAEVPSRTTAHQPDRDMGAKNCTKAFPPTTPARVGGLMQ